MPIDYSSAPPSAPPRVSSGRNVSKRESPKLSERREALQGAWQLAGFGCIMFKQYADAGAIGMHSEPITDELVTLSSKNESIAKALDYLTEAGPYAGLVIAVLPLTLQIMANHGLVKAEYLGSSGVVPPAALRAQVEADMARQASEALRAQQEAERELATLAASMSPQKPSEPSSEPNGQTASRTPRRAKAGN